MKKTVWALFSYISAAVTTIWMCMCV